MLAGAKSALLTLKKEGGIKKERTEVPDPDIPRTTRTSTTRTLKDATQQLEKGSAGRLNQG